MTKRSFRVRRPQMNTFILFCKIFLVISVLKKTYSTKKFSNEEYAELAIMIGDIIHDMVNIMNNQNL